MEKHSLSKNFTYQLLYQILILVIPLVLSPYLTRTLQETALGNYTYVNSVACYFVLISMLGISRYGQRVIAQNYDDKLMLRRTFWSLYYDHIVTSIIALVAYIIFICFCRNDNILIYIIEIFYVLSGLFDVTWFFYGIENFRSVVIKNAFVKIAECILIFLLIRTPDDIYIYTLICAGSILAGQIVMLPQVISIVRPISVSKAEMVVHIKPLLFFSISVIAASLYTVFDKTLLGIMTNPENVAFYEYANKIITIPKTLITTIGTVMFPRACRLVTAGDTDGQRHYIKYSLIMTSFIGMGSLFGLLAVAEPFAVLYYGKSFAVSGKIMMAMSPLVYIIGAGDILRTQFLIPNHMDKEFNLCIVLNAIINIIISVSLIPTLGVFGAVLGTIAAELFGLVFQLIVSRKFISFEDIVFSLVPFIIIGFTMHLVVMAMMDLMDNSLSSLIIQIGVGGLTFFLLSFIYLIVQHKDIRKIVKKRIFK